MPYIKDYMREGIRDRHTPPKGPGDLNYLFTDIILRYFEEHHNYQGINDIIGALEGAKLEFYRRHVVPYEDTKIVENGDVT